VSHRIIWSWYTGRWWMGCYIWYSEGLGGTAARPGHRCTKCNNPPIPSTASVPITVLLYNILLVCSFNVPIKGLMTSCSDSTTTRWYWLVTNDAIEKSGYVTCVGSSLELPTHRPVNRTWSAVAPSTGVMSNSHTANPFLSTFKVSLARLASCVFSWRHPAYLCL